MSNITIENIDNNVNLNKYLTNNELCIITEENYEIVKRYLEKIGIPFKVIDK